VSAGPLGRTGGYVAHDGYGATSLADNVGKVGMTRHRHVLAEAAAAILTSAH
jgi:hypothetical protein